jgi:hypothetical protein
VAEKTRPPAWRSERRPWDQGDAVAILVWTVAIAVYFAKAVSLREALFYFDITEINYPYRDFFASELKAGRFSRWHPGLYCGFPLYSESQAGYFHPLKYLFYPWLATWQAFNLDTIGSVWLTGIGTYGWLRRHVGPAGALTGAAVFGLSGFMWAHLIHTSMLNALASVPPVIWSLEAAWDSGRLRPLALGALAMSCQVFAGHLQDTILTAAAVGLYALFRAATERGLHARLGALGLAGGLVVLALVIAAVQWIPSKELLDRSPRAQGLTWDDLTFGSWHPELLPTLIVREAYGTRARDTDWLDGFYPYHEMNAYLGMIALALAIVGAAAYRDRWVGFWIILAGVGGVLMLGRFTFVFDHAHQVPIAGSSRIPVRFHLWVALATAALAAVGVDRLERLGAVRLRLALGTMAVLILLSIPILVYIYAPIWTEPSRWTHPNDQALFRRLEREPLFAALRTFALAGAAGAIAVLAARTAQPRRRAGLAAVLPLLVIADLLGAHWFDVPTIDPRYWTEPPESARELVADPACVRVFGIAQKSAGEPGYADLPVDFLAVRDPLGWSLPPVWGLRSSSGVTPMVPRRLMALTHGELAAERQYLLDIQAVTHELTGRDLRGMFGSARPVGRAFIAHNASAQPRLRLMGQPYYAAGEAEATAAVRRLGALVRNRVVVEDPDRPLPEGAEAVGRVEIVREEPERIEVAVGAGTDAYLTLADCFDPGWSATLDGRPVPIRPAWITFRAVFVPRGAHTVIFRYRPAGFDQGLAITAAGLLIVVAGLAWPRRLVTLAPEHGDFGWPQSWPRWGLLLIGLIVLASTIAVGSSGIGIQSRWDKSFHRFTWGAGIESMKRAPGEP